MSVSLSVRWPDVPLVGAVGAGRHDDTALPVPEGFTLTPSGQGEQDNAQKVSRDTFDEEVPGIAGPEQPC